MFKVKLEGLNKVKAQFASVSADLEKIVDSELQAMAADWVRNAQNDAPVDQGTLKAGITWYQEGKLRVIITSNVFYSAFMEFGTKGRYRPIPGTEAIAAQFRGYKKGDFMELLRMIVKWVARKGITGTYSVKTRRRTGGKAKQAGENLAAAWPIALLIIKNGVHPHPFFFKQQDIVWPDMIRRVEQRLKQQTKVSVVLPGDIQRPRIITI